MSNHIRTFFDFSEVYESLSLKCWLDMEIYVDD